MSAPTPTATSVTVTAAAPAEELSKHALSALEELSYLSPLYQHGSISLLIKILEHVLNAPDDAKYRRVNAMKILPKLRTKAGLKLLESLGFKHATAAVVKQNPSEDEFMTMAEVPDSHKLKQLRLVVQKLKDILAGTDANATTPTSTTPSTSSSSTASSPATYALVPIPATLPFKQLQPQEGDLVEDDKFVLFWHPPSWANQWTMVPFVIDEVTYCCPEQWMMASKAKLFGDHATFARIMMSGSAREMKKLGREVTNFKADVWDKNALDIVVKGTYAKFTQHPAFKKRLLSTGNKTLVEASPLDSIWGVGLAASNPDIRSPSKWLGTNWLGVALGRVREMLREQEGNEGIFQ